MTKTEQCSSKICFYYISLAVDKIEQGSKKFRIISHIRHNHNASQVHVLVENCSNFIDFN